MNDRQANTIWSWMKKGLALGLSISALATDFTWAADPAPPVAPPAPVAAAIAPILRLDDCLRLGRQNQQSIQAAQASLASAQAAQRGLNELRLGSRFSKELPIRKQQAAHGVNAAASNLCQVQRDVDASVARMYFSVIYARAQKKVAEQISARLRASVAVGETLLGKEGAPADLNPTTIGRAKMFSSLASARVDEAHRGLSRATAALREAMGLGPEFQFQVAEDVLPPVMQGINKDQIVQLAQSMRGEVGMAQSAVCVTRLEIQAQGAARMPKRPTSAAGGDVHARPVPSGSFGDDYKPGAIGLDFPTLFVGPRETRMQRAGEVSHRADAAADKARNLVGLEAEDTFYKWEEAVSKITKFAAAAQEAEKLAKQTENALETGVIQSYRDLLEVLVIGAQIQANLNEAKYNHAVALTEFERVTNGGFPTVTVNVH